MSMTEDKLIRRFTKEFPKTAEHAAKYEFSDWNELTITMNSGDKVLYDDICKTCRALPTDPNNMTEQETRDEFRKRLHSIMKIEGVNQRELSERSGVANHQ